MTGSAVDGEDVLQDSLIKALNAWSEGAVVENPTGWLIRITHNSCLDFLRRRARTNIVPFDDYREEARMPDADIVSVGFQTFLCLPELQRCAVILKDVLGHSVDEIATIADCTLAAAKSALQRGRVSLRELARSADDARVPLMPETDRQKMARYVRLFQSGDFDAIRAMLAEDVKLELVNRLRMEGRDNISRYFTAYVEAAKWRYAFGAIEGRPALLVFDTTAPAEKPAHFALLDWREDRIVGIRDFLYAPYVLDGIDWVRLA
jgi:RNA polymerase sigma-70 factor (ECF subfamily)